ncbi:Avo1 protein [Maudiozyma humilis]|uniref:Avo1 protein n=1 Tax=Maudiozyma humilis TaxID=51915 RepID=A0AAV5S542_MAUHU|nr:Avo1 protein [Kazachstania humilis]
MDTSIAINQLRAQFLRVCPERDQGRRIIRPYTQDTHDAGSPRMPLPDRIKEMYYDKDGAFMLPELESPPISNNFLENYPVTRRVRSGRAHQTAKLPARDGIDNDETPRATEDQTLTRTSRWHDDPSILQGDSVLFNQGKNSSAAAPPPQPQQFASVTYDSDDSDSDSQKRNSKKSSLPFTRIFKGSKRDSKGHGHGAMSAAATAASAAGNAANAAAHHLRKHSKYAMNFDYDENLDEDLEDEGEDEDEAIEDNQLRAQFFQLDATSSNNNNAAMDNAQAQPPQQLTNNTPGGNRGFSLEGRSLLDRNFSNGSENDDERKKPLSASLLNSDANQPAQPDNVSSNGIINNVSRFKSHLPQIPILDSGRNANANAPKQDPANDSSNRTLSSGTKGSSHHGDKTEDSDLSDIESFIKEDDLKSINLDAANSSHNAKSMVLSPIDSTKHMEYAHSLSDIPHEPLSDGESHDLSEVSSFGKSLLGSEYTSNEFLKRDDSDIATDRISLDTDTDIGHHTLSSHSIPISFEGYGLYQAANDSTLNNVLDKAVSRIRSNGPLSNPGAGLGPSRERANSTASRRNSISQTLTSKRSSIASNHHNHTFKQSALRNHLRSTSNNIGESNNKHASLYGSSLHKGKTLAKPNVTPSRSSAHTSRRNSRDTLLRFEKVTTIPAAAAKPATSNLSSLFNKKKHKVTSAAEVLEYFSFVSGNTVPRFDAMDLEVYIQASKKYKRTSFKTKVRKSAKIFDVIGYILYLYTTEQKPDSIEADGLDMHTLMDPNNFALHIVDEDGDPFEDNFGKLNRTATMQSISDNEIVLCKVGEDEKLQNEGETPVPYDVNGDVIEYARSVSSKVSGTTGNNSSAEEPTLNQLSFYKPMVGPNTDDLGVAGANSSNVLEVTVYMYPNVNPKFNFTTIKVLVTGNINDILVKYCRMKGMDPNEYSLKVIGKSQVYDLNDTVLRLDGQNKVEIISKKEARKLQLEKIKPNIAKPQLPTIQSNDLTPMTLEPAPAFLTQEANTADGAAPATEVPVPVNMLRKTSGKFKSLSKHSSGSSNGANQPGAGANASNAGLGPGAGTLPAGGSSGFFKNKNTSRGSLHTPIQTYHNNHSGMLEYTPDTASNGNATNNFQDLFSGAYHKYKVWRRQQMSLITKHERTLALDGDYVYIVPPEGKMHWHENVKTKSFHISQVVLVKKSKRVAEYFKIYVRRGPDDIKRYYFEAVSAQECTEIVTRITNLLNAYKMNHK